METIKSPFNSVEIKPSVSSIRNHLVHISKSSGRGFVDIAKEWLIYVNGKTLAPCGKEATVFAGLNQGMICDCGICETLRKTVSREIVSNERLAKREAFIQYLKSNVDFYVEHLRSKNIVEPYGGNHIGNITLSSHISRTYLDGSLNTCKELLFDSICHFCGMRFQGNLLIRKRACSRKSCVSFRVHANYDDLSVVDKMKYDFDLCKTVCDIKTFAENYKPLKVSKKITGDLYRDSHYKSMLLKYSLYYESVEYFEYSGKVFVHLPRTTVLKRHLETCGYGSNENDLLLYGEKECVICGSKYRTLRPFCSKRCYHRSLSKEFCFDLYPEKYTNEKRAIASDRMKSAILNGDFTPRVTNSWAKSRVVVSVNGVSVPCRSSWEAVFQIANPECVFEKIRIPYLGKDGNPHSYIVDFVAEKKRILYEIKPKSKIDDALVIIKEDAARSWCAVNGYEFVFVSDEWFDEFFTNGGADLVKLQKEHQIILRRMKTFIKE
ncbi:MAG: Tn7 transposase TnsA N-terminal domain-containing protein [Desulfuromonadaceae bacterium]